MFKPQKIEWEKFYEDDLFTERYPSDSVIRLLCSYRKQSGFQGARVLDLGCGGGRHLWLAAKEGFSAYGIDLSSQAIQKAKNWLEKEKLPFEDLRSGNIFEKLPYADNFFDIVISYGVLDHLAMAEAKKALAEARRVLRPEGTLFLKLESTTSFTYDPTRQVDHHEIILDKEAEKGIIQHFFDKEEVADLTRDFKAIRVFREDYRRFENLDKNYQSRWIFIGKKP